VTQQQILPTNAEKQAKASETLSAFSGLNLLHIRRSVTELLGLIGRDGIFDEYTVHDISHIDSMLDSLDWIIPDSTKQIMSPADWLMTTLSIYFHDLGMLVTKREYENRSQSDFPRYRDETLFAGPNGEDYRLKVASLGSDRAERFLYQEFVRHKHAERVRAWVAGTTRFDLGHTPDAASQIDKLLAPLGPLFRRDLGLICESHHLNDLGELTKYKPSQPYGNSDSETVNLQYCAVLLRSADLLHITSNRTPSVTFKTINPTDPISQEEWAKQQAVTRVRSKPGLNDEGVADEHAVRDTIEVNAYFTNETGFFGLTSYLVYAANQLRQSNEWVTTTKKQNFAKHEFPWRKIDDTQIETEGFIRESFEFTIDQAKILDLLTGHTLYNDTRVVIRELVQNAIDAIRLEWYQKSPETEGKVQIHWDSQGHALTVIDNGTGMTQEIISNFLLRVGTSRYQDPEFKKQYPSFTSISRFGIGVLSTFMIADSVDITTCHPGDDKARRLTLRSVHGKYLIRLLEKTDGAVAAVAPHGTQFTLRIRPSVKMPDVLETTKFWVVVPTCTVTVGIDTASPIRVGFKSTAEALQAQLTDSGMSVEIGTDSRPPPPSHSDRSPLRVLERTRDGISVAYAVQWSSHFREWSFVEQNRVAREESEAPAPLGTCIEGIRVEASTPGFEGLRILALANVTGPAAPKTNVARSGIEATPERDTLLRGIYAVYSAHVESEINELQTSRSFSLTWAVQEARYLLGSIYGTSPERGQRAVSARLLKDVVSEIRFLPVERSGNREAISPSALAAEGGFWTIDSGLLRSAEPLIREAATSGSLSRLLGSLDIPNFSFPNDLVLCGLSPDDQFAEFAFAEREVDRIVIHRDQRRVDLHWSRAASPKRWLSYPERAESVLFRLSRRRQLNRARQGVPPLLVGVGGIEITPHAQETAILAFGQLFILPGSKISGYLINLIASTAKAQTTSKLVGLSMVFSIVDTCCGHTGPIEDADALVRRELRRVEDEWPSVSQVQEFVDVVQLTEIIEATSWSTFNPSAWRRSSAE
jgi:molecular chaperone HtpG